MHTDMDEKDSVEVVTVLRCAIFHRTHSDLFRIEMFSIREMHICVMNMRTCVRMVQSN